MKTLTERLKTTREDQELTQQDLANKAKMSQSIIGVLESGTQKSSSWLPEIAHALNVDAYWLKTGKGNKSGNGRHLTDDEKIILEAFPLFSDDLKESWLEAARRAIDKAESMQKP